MHYILKQMLVAQHDSYSLQLCMFVFGMNSCQALL